MKNHSLLFTSLFAFILSGCVIPSGTPAQPITPDPGPIDDEDDDIDPVPPTPTEYEWKYTLDFSQCGFEDGNTISETELPITTDIKFEFTNKGHLSGHKTAAYNNAVRFYNQNSFSLLSSVETLTKINFTFGSKDKTNEITANCGSFNGSTWAGSSKTIEFTIGGDSGCREISTIEVVFKKDTQQPQGDTPISPTSTDLGTKTISEVKEYIASNPVTTNAGGVGVNKNVYVTIKGLALARINLIKSTKSFGLDVSQPAKVIIGDFTGYIGVATRVGDGTIWDKVGDYVNKDTSKYEVTGYISEYLGNPELEVISYKWDQNLTVNVNPEAYSTDTINLTELYNKATAINYNCAGHGYGEVVTLKNLYCYNRETGGSGKRYFNFTDGANNIRVLSYNVGDCSVGSYYDVTGILTMENYSTAVTAFKINVSAQNSFDFDYETVCEDITIENLRKIKGEKDDTNTRFPDLIKHFGKFYKTTGYLTFVEEGGNLYIGISDTYSKSFITGKNNAMSKGVALIRNENTFWNIGKYLEDFKTLEYVNENNFYFREEKQTVYYIPRSIGYQSNDVMWTIYAIPESIESMVNIVEE